jgi:hypothetical protein
MTELRLAVFRGPQSRIPVLKPGEFGFTTDTTRLFIGSSIGNIEIGSITQLSNAINTINARIDIEVSTLNTTIDNHKNATTAHSVTQISDAESVTGSQAKVDAHANRTDNPHNVTSEQVNAYTKTATDTNIATNLQIAKTYTDNAISALINGSPSILDTLYELSNALGNDPNFSTTVLTEISEVDTKINTHATHMNPIIAAIVFGG